MSKKSRNQKSSRNNQMNTNTNFSKSPKSNQIFTNGLVIQRTYFKDVLALKTFKNLDARLILKAADERKQDLVILAGSFESKKGVFGVIGDGSIASLAIAAANRRMKEVGSKGTMWMVIGDEEFVKCHSAHIKNLGEATELDWRTLH
jgi:hypothetical protein